jgi:hypothetical protein
MVSEVKTIISTDIFDLENYKPDDDENFSFLLTVTVGLRGEIGGDNLDIEVCTPKWLVERQYGEIILGKGKLIVFKCEMKRILARVRALFDGCSGKDWSEIAIKLSRIGIWEFEDYRG